MLSNGYYVLQKIGFDFWLSAGRERYMTPFLLLMSLTDKMLDHHDILIIILFKVRKCLKPKIKGVMLHCFVVMRITFQQVK